MKDFEAEGLQIKLLNEGDRVTMQWLGKSDSREPSAVITPFFEEVVPEFDGKSVVVEFQNLRYINSSTIPTILSLMKQLSERNIGTTITFNKNSSWQSASFKALQTISKNMDNITVEGLDL
jgi:hypothetical protein